MATVAQSLFGVTPESLMAAREQRLQEQALQFAQLSPMQAAQAGFYTAGSRLGTGIGGLLGAQDPELQKARTLQSLMSGADTTTFEGQADLARKLAQAGFAAQAMQVADSAQALRTKQAQATKAEVGLKREEDYRKALADLPANATEDDIKKVLMKFGEADKLLTVLSNSADRAANRENQLLMARERADASIKAAQERADAMLQAARERGATQQQIAQMQIESRNQIAQMQTDARLEIAKLTAALKQDKGAEVDDKSATRIGQNVIFDKLSTDGEKLITQIDQNKKAFTLAGRGEALVKSVTNPDDPIVKARSDVDAYLNKARNAYLLAAKGTQTEGDAQRAWQEFAGSLDFSSAEGAKRSVERIRTELQTQKQANEAYLRSRRVTAPAAAAPAADGWSIKVK